MTATRDADWLLDQATQRANLSAPQAQRVKAVLVAAMLAGAGHKEVDSPARKLVTAALPAAARLVRRYRRTQKQLDTSGLPDALAWLIGLLADLLAGLWDDLTGGGIDPQQWYDDVADALAEYHAAAWMAGSGQMKLPLDAVEKVANTVEAQLAFLDNFKVEVQSAAEFAPGWASRAESYANSIKTPYWKGKTDVLPLPAMPGDGTSDCLGNCRCLWDITPLDAEKGDYDCRWVLDSSAKHCANCLQRAADWAPLRIRDFQLVL